MSESDKIWVKGFIVFFITLFIFCIGMVSGKAYVIKYQQIHSTENGYCVEIDFKEYEYEYVTENNNR